MALYRITWDGLDILNWGEWNMVLLSPRLVMEINTAGSLRFVVPPKHLFYNMFTSDNMFKPTVEVYEDDTMIWFGRPVELKTDFYKQKEVYCEGALAFFNDSVQEDQEFDNVGIHSFFQQVIELHNAQVDSSRRFAIGNITIPDKTVYRYTKYENSLSVLRGQCLETNDGYFFLRHENGQNYIDWLEDMPYTCNQIIEFSSNMLNVASSFIGTDFATCVMPLGSNDSNTGKPLTIANVNGGSTILRSSELVALYGVIVAVLQLSDIDDINELKTEGEKALERIKYNSQIIECSAADLHSKDGSKEIFRIGQIVHCESSPHDLSVNLPLSKMELSLDTAAKNITLGILPKKSLTRISKNKKTNSGGGNYDDPYYTPPADEVDPSIIDDWEIIFPDNPGDPITAIRIPTHIEIARNPNKIKYEPGEDLDFTGLVVNIRTENSNGEEIAWTNPPRYIDGTVPKAELIFSAKKAPNIKNFNISIIWKYKGKSYSALLPLSTEKALNPSPLRAPIPKSSTGTARFGVFVQNYYFSSGSGFYTQWLVTQKSCGHLAASPQPGAALSMRDGWNVVRWTQQLTSQFTYDGKTVYYWFNSKGGDWPGTYQSMSPLCNGGEYVNGVTDHSAAAAAWLMIYG